MQINILNILLTLSYSMSIAFGQILYNYEIEFLEPKIYTPCESYPDNFIDQLFDFSNLHIEQTDDGSLIVKGYTITKKTVEQSQPLILEVFKKERGTWQPTVITQNRKDFCSASFDNTEVWHSYLMNTPKEQLTCPFYEGQRIDFDINDPTHITSPMRNADGEYNFHTEVGQNAGDFFLCVDIFVRVHKV